MRSADDPTHRKILDSTSIDELWKTLSPVQSLWPPRGGGNCMDDSEMYHTTEEDLSEVPEVYITDSEMGDDSALSRDANCPGQTLESYFLSRESIRIPEAANCTSIEPGSYTNLELKGPRAVAVLPSNGDEELNQMSRILSMPTVTLHTNQVFSRNDTLGAAMASSTIPFIPIHLQFDDINYKIITRKKSTNSKVSLDMSALWSKKQGKGSNFKAAAAAFDHDLGAEKHILNSVSGSVTPGEILAMMGPSGSGKTTMLNILGGRLQHEKYTGKIAYNGLPYFSALKRRIGYVSQDDVLFPLLTVRETLVFSAMLRLSKKMSHREKVGRAEIVLKELGLERCQNTIVGGPFIRGVSGGERKRTSIGYELLVDPSLLLLDEPTSGLDSTTAFRILQLLRANAKIGRVIVATIHQPSSRLFPMFDKLLLLSEGHPLYFGAAKDAMEYFGSLQFIPQLSMNPSDFLLDLASGITSDMTVPQELSNLDNGESTSARDDHSNLHNISTYGTETYSGSLHAAESEESQASRLQDPDTASDEHQRQLVMKHLRQKYRIELEQTEKTELHPLNDFMQERGRISTMKIKEQWNSSWWQQFIVLCRRNCKERKNDYMNLLRFGQGVAVAILLSMLWWRLKLETEQKIRDQVGLLFYITIFWCTFAMWSTLMTFPMEKDYLAKERASDMYRLSAYYLSSTWCDLVAELVHPTLFTALVYFTTGLKSDAITFLLTLLSIYLITITAQAFGEFFGAATLNSKRVGIVSSMIMLIFLLAGGYYVQNIPVFLRWMRYLSIVFYGFNLLQRVQYSPDQTYNCHELGGCLRYDESPMFENMNLDGGLHDACALIAMVLIYKILAYVCLRRV